MKATRLNCTNEKVREGRDNLSTSKGVVSHQAVRRRRVPSTAPVGPRNSGDGLMTPPPALPVSNHAGRAVGSHRPCCLHKPLPCRRSKAHRATRRPTKSYAGVLARPIFESPECKAGSRPTPPAPKALTRPSARTTQRASPAAGRPHVRVIDTAAR